MGSFNNVNIAGSLHTDRGSLNKIYKSNNKRIINYGGTTPTVQFKPHYVTKMKNAQSTDKNYNKGLGMNIEEYDPNRKQIISNTHT